MTVHVFQIVALAPGNDAHRRIDCACGWGAFASDDEQAKDMGGQHVRVLGCLGFSRVLSQAEMSGDVDREQIPIDGPMDLCENCEAIRAQHWILGDRSSGFLAGYARAMPVPLMSSGDLVKAAHDLVARIEARQPEGRESFASAVRDERQRLIHAWARAAFTVEQATSLPQRGLRLLEEAIELFQACGGEPARAHKLIDYVFDRPPGEIGQELGGVAVTTLALAAAAGLSADAEERREVSRVLGKPIEEFTRRNAAKNAAGFLAADAHAARSEAVPEPDACELCGVTRGGHAADCFLAGTAKS